MSNKTASVKNSTIIIGSGNGDINIGSVVGNSKKKQSTAGSGKKGVKTSPQAKKQTQTRTETKTRARQSLAVTGKKVFISYCHKDKDYLDRLLVHLKPLERAGLIEPWVDTRLKAGDRWHQEIESALQSASVAILLVSADFLASDFIVNNELPPLLEQAQQGGTRIMPLILKPCGFNRHPALSHYQCHNSPDQPLSSLSESECEAYFDSLAANF